MNHILITWKAAVVACCTALTAFLGWRGILAIVWVAAMALDYLSGTVAAMKAGAWSSTTARQGILHKAGMIFVVLVAGLSDLGMGVTCDYLAVGLTWPNVILPLVLAWYIVTELGSVLENAVQLGAAVPAWLTKLLAASLTAIDSAGGAAAGEEKGE